jgi:hypothetical protein
MASGDWKCAWRRRTPAGNHIRTMLVQTKKISTYLVQWRMLRTGSAKKSEYSSRLFAENNRLFAEDGCFSCELRQLGQLGMVIASMDFRVRRLVPSRSVLVRRQRSALPVLNFICGRESCAGFSTRSD